MRKHLSLTFLIALVLLTALAALPVYAQNGRGQGLERAIVAKEFHTNVLLETRGVVGTGVGLGANGQPVVKIFTEAAGIRGLPRILDGVQVEVQVTGEIFALHHKSWHGGGDSNEAPVVSIDSPDDGYVSEDETNAISFEGVANDPEDGGLTDSIEWASNIDGVIGGEVGGNISTTLSAGIHTITASVTDSDGKTGSDSITITVGDVVDPKVLFDRPVPIGVSSGSERLIQFRGRLYCTVGTIGARLKDGTDVYALSNNHVYALEGDGEVNVDRILQPGRVDMTDQACGSDNEIGSSVIGTLSAFVPIEFSRNASNKVDAAVASVDSGDFDRDGTIELAVGNATPSDGYGTPKSTIYVVSDQDVDVLAVQKYGRTTALTDGVVTAIAASVIVRYDAGQARFDGQIIIEGTNGSFSAGGDSGSLVVVTGTNDPVGLLFAGSSSITIANPIDDVLSELATELGKNLEIDGN